MKFRATIRVGLRKDYVDPESETVKKTLTDLNFQVSQVRISKTYEIVVDAGTKKDAENAARSMCARLLVNPTKDEYSLEVEPISGSSRS